MSDPSVVGRIALIAALIVFGIVFLFRKRLMAGIGALKRKGNDAEAPAPKADPGIMPQEKSGPDRAQSGIDLKVAQIAEKIIRFVGEYLHVFYQKMFKKKDKKIGPAQPSQ